MAGRYPEGGVARVADLLGQRLVERVREAQARARRPGRATPIEVELIMSKAADQAA